MEPVDVLRDHRRHPPRPDERRNAEMPPVRLRVAIEIVHDEFAPPCLTPRLRASEEVLEGDRPVTHPRTVGGAKVRNAAFRRDARARKTSDDPSALNHFLQ